MALRFYRVEGAGGCGAAVNGWYERQGTSNDKPKYHQIGGTGIIYYYSNDRWTEFNDRWKLNDEDDEDGWYYSRAESSDTPPEGQWTTEGFGGSGADPPPTLTAHSSMDHGDALASGNARRSALRFYRVEGAGGRGAGVNGWYERQGTSNGKPKYHQIGGTGIIYCRRNWKINNQDNDGGWYYSRAESGGTPPEGQWTTEGYGGSDADPPPTLTAHSSMDDGDSSASGEVPLELLVQGAGGSDGRQVNGYYRKTGTHDGKPIYQEVHDPRKKVIYFDASRGSRNVWKITHRGYQSFRYWTFQHHDSSASAPPSDEWTRDGYEGDVDEIPTILVVPQMLRVELAATDSLNGLYIRADEANGKPRYLQAGGTSVMDFEDGWKIRVEAGSEHEFAHPDAGAGVPPTGQWTTNAPTISQAHALHAQAPRFYRIEGAGGVGSRVNGWYACLGTCNNKPKYHQIGGTGIIYCRGNWKIGYRDNERGWYYSRAESGGTPPEGQWTTEGYDDSDADPPPTLTAHSFMDDGDASASGDARRSALRFYRVEGAGGRGAGVNGWYERQGTSNDKPKYHQLGGTGIIYCRRNWKINYEDNEGGWYYSRAESGGTPPEGQWTTEGYSDSDADPPPNLTAHSSMDVQHPDAQPPSVEPPPFFVVRGAGLSSVNGRYAHVGSHGGRPKYRKVVGEAIIFLEAGVWRLNTEENTNQRCYDGVDRTAAFPPSDWETIDRDDRPAPTVSMGTWQDLQVGDKVTFKEGDGAADWSGSLTAVPGEPGRSPHSLSYSAGDSQCIREISGEFFFSQVWQRLYAPLDALGVVQLRGTDHCIKAAVRRGRGDRGASEAASPPRTEHQDVTEEVTGGYDEDWVEDVERFKCPICLQVARNAISHDCGSALFCELCWVISQADDEKCPVCREDGRTVAPSYFERRSIKNLMVKCPNACGGTFALHDKARHLKDQCSKRRVTCSSCDGWFVFEQLEEHEQECAARLAEHTTCRLCGEKVRKDELEAHYGSNPGKHIMHIASLLDEVASLREEVQTLKCRLGET